MTHPDIKAAHLERALAAERAYWHARFMAVFDAPLSDTSACMEVVRANGAFLALDRIATYITPPAPAGTTTEET